MSNGNCRSRTTTTAACKNVNFTLTSHVLYYVKCYVKFRPRAAGAVKLTPRVKLTRVNVKLKLRNLASHRTLGELGYTSTGYSTSTGELITVPTRTLPWVLYGTVVWIG